MTRRLLISYLSLTVVVLAMLEVPLGFINARGERAQLTAKVERDAVTIASLAESTLEGDAPTSNLPAIEALGRRYAADTGARVVITNRKGVAVVDSAPADAGPAELRDAAGVPGRAPRRRRDRDPPLEHARLRPPLRRGADRLGRHRPRRRPDHLPDLRARPARAQLLARARRDRRRRARGGDAHRPQLRPLDPPPARRARGGRGGRGCRRPLGARARCPTRRPSCAGSRSSSTTWWRASTGSSPCSRSSSRTPRTSCARRSRRCGCGSRTSSGTSATTAARSLAAAATEVERLSGLVDELLALARADAGTAPAETVDLAAVAAARIDAWLPTAAERAPASSMRTGAGDGAGRPRPRRAGDRQPRLERAAPRARELRRHGLRRAAPGASSSSASPTRARG